MTEKFITREEFNMKINVAKAIGALAALRTLTSVAIFVSLGAFSVMVGGYFSLANKIDAVQAGQDALKTDVAVLQAGQDALKTDVAVLRAGQDALKTDVAALKTDVAALKIDVITLQEGQARITAALQQASIIE